MKPLQLLEYLKLFATIKYRFYEQLGDQARADAYGDLAVEVERISGTIAEQEILNQPIEKNPEEPRAELH